MAGEILSPYSQHFVGIQTLIEPNHHYLDFKFMLGYYFPNPSIPEYIDSIKVVMPSQNLNPLILPCLVDTTYTVEMFGTI